MQRQPSKGRVGSGHSALANAPLCNGPENKPKSLTLCVMMVREREYEKDRERGKGRGAHEGEKGVEEKEDWKERERKSGRMRRERRRSEGGRRGERDRRSPNRYPLPPITSQVRLSLAIIATNWKNLNKLLAQLCATEIHSHRQDRTDPLRQSALLWCHRGSTDT